MYSERKEALHWAKARLSSFSLKAFKMVLYCLKGKAHRGVLERVFGNSSVEAYDGLLLTSFLEEPLSLGLLLETEELFIKA